MKGPRGATGNRGAPGPRGGPGVDSAKGEVGPAGSNGDDGNPGLPGPAGPHVLVYNYANSCILYMYTTRVIEVHKDVEAYQVFKDRQEMRATLDQLDSQERKECQELMDYLEIKETLEHR